MPDDRQPGSDAKQLLSSMDNLWPADVRTQELVADVLGVSRSEMAGMTVEYNPSTTEYLVTDGQGRQQRLTAAAVTAANTPNTTQHTKKLDPPKVVTYNARGFLLLSTPSELPLHMVITWQSKGRSQVFNYAAVWVKSVERWFITGKGAWYGTNALTHDQLLEVLERTSTNSIYIATEWSGR